MKLEWEKVNKILMLVLIVGFLMRIIFMFYSPVRGWDETDYLSLGKVLSTNPLHYSLLHGGWNDFIPSKDVVYGWPNTGFRAPLLPYSLATLYFLKLDFLIPFLVPFFATFSIYLVYVLGKMLFDKKVGLYSAILLTLIPIHVSFSQKVLTDTFVVFFMLLTFISFWKGYEHNNKRHKVLFGFFLALALLARYTTLWITPIFLIYFLIRDRSLNFLKDKYIWAAVGVFFLTMIPWFIYGIAYYHNPIGPFIHGFKASTYWGGVQPWYFFIADSWQNFSIISLLLVSAILYILIKKDYLKKEIYFLLIWLVVFSALAMQTPHKEDRLIMPIVPVICILSGYIIYKIKNHQKIIFGIIIIVLAFSFVNATRADYVNNKSGAVECFSKGNEYLSQVGNKDSVVVSNQSPIVHYYTGKDIEFYPDPWSLDELKNMIKSKTAEKAYIFFSNYDMDMKSSIKTDLDNNMKKVFECETGWGYSAIYEY